MNKRERIDRGYWTLKGTALESLKKDIIDVEVLENRHVNHVDYFCNELVYIIITKTAKLIVVRQPTSNVSALYNTKIINLTTGEVFNHVDKNPKTEV